MITINVENQIFPVPDDIASTDELLKAALAPFVPWITNAQIHRKEEKGEMVVSVIKRADTKGNADAVVSALIASPEEMNRAVALWLDLQRRVDLNNPATVIALESTINDAIASGEKEIASVQKSLVRLVECAPVPSSRTPLGF